MACSMLALALLSSFAITFVWSRRVTQGGSKIDSADVAQQPQDGAIFVKGFDHGTDEEALNKHFGAVGAIKDLRFQGRGAAVITYKKLNAATRAVNELNDRPLKGQSRNVVVKMSDPDRERQGAKSLKEGGSKPSGRTIFVNGLEPATDDAALMKQFGTVGAIEDHYFQSKISAVITYVKASSAQQAVAKLDGSVLSSQTCYVTVKLNDRDRNGAAQSEPSAPGKGSSRGIYVSGFEWETDGAALEKHFGSVGKMKSCHFQSKGAAVVTFVKAGAAQRAVTELAGTTMDGQRRYVAVKLDNPEHRVQKQLEAKGN